MIGKATSQKRKSWINGKKKRKKEVRRGGTRTCHESLLEKVEMSGGGSE